MKNDYIKFRCSEKLKEEIAKRAEAEEKSMSEYITDLIKADIAKAAAETGNE